MNRKQFISRFGVFGFGLMIGLSGGIQMYSDKYGLRWTDLSNLFFWEYLLGWVLAGVLGGYLYGVLLWRTTHPRDSE